MTSKKSFSGLINESTLVIFGGNLNTGINMVLFVFKVLWFLKKDVLMSDVLFLFLIFLKKV